MLSVKGTFQNGVALPAEVVEGREGRPVLITFIDEAGDPTPAPPDVEGGYGALIRLIDDCQVESGRSDLAHQHDHYLYGTPKRP